jgi:hypothetical protein
MEDGRSCKRAAEHKWANRGREVETMYLSLAYVEVDVEGSAYLEGRTSQSKGKLTSALSNKLSSQSLTLSQTR